MDAFLPFKGTVYPKMKILNFFTLTLLTFIVWTKNKKINTDIFSKSENKFLNNIRVCKLSLIFRCIIPLR